MEFGGARQNSKVLANCLQSSLASPPPPRSITSYAPSHSSFGVVNKSLICWLLDHLQINAKIECIKYGGLLSGVFGEK